MVYAISYEYIMEIWSFANNLFKSFYAAMEISDYAITILPW